MPSRAFVSWEKESKCHSRTARFLGDNINFEFNFGLICYHAKRRGPERAPRPGPHILQVHEPGAQAPECSRSQIEEPAECGGGGQPFEGRGGDDGTMQHSGADPPRSGCFVKMQTSFSKQSDVVCQKVHVEGRFAGRLRWAPTSSDPPRRCWTIRPWSVGSRLGNGMPRRPQRT